MSFILSKLFWLFLSPGSVLVLMLLLGAFLAVGHKENHQKLGRHLCFAAALLFFFVGILPVGSWMLVPLENRFPPASPPEVAGIILLGGDEKPHGGDEGRPVFLDSARRYIEFASLARRYPKAKLIFSGGAPLLTHNPDLSNAAIAKRALAGLGVPVDTMMFEDVSRNTRENAVRSFDMAKPKPDETWLLVTSAYHMPRAMATFRKVGWKVEPATTGYLTDGTFSKHLNFNLGEHLVEMSWAVHEYYGLLAYRLMGYTDTLWPG